MKRLPFLSLIFFLSIFSLGAQSQRTDAPYLLPQTIFVGDEGRLVVPLGERFSAPEPFVRDFRGDSFERSPEKLPDIVVRRIELERRAGGTRLLIDFIPYVPGTLLIPPIDLLSSDLVPSGVLPSGLSSAGTDPSEEEARDFIISGLEVHVASILDPAWMELSSAAAPLAVPGTSFLVYGTIVMVLLLLFLAVWGSLWGRRHFRDIWERLRRRHLLRNMARFLRRVRQECGPERQGNPAFYLSLLSGEFREFLSLFTGVNCRSLSAGEFSEFILLNLQPARAEITSGANAAKLISGSFNTGGAFLNPDFLCRLFRTWDTMRFSGREIKTHDLFDAVGDTERFIIALDKLEREKPFAKQARDEKTAAGGSA